MMKFIKLCVLAGILFTSAALTQADESSDIEHVLTEVKKMFPRAANAKITPAPAAGVYQLDVGGSYAYIYLNGDHLLIGELYDTKQQVNIGEQIRTQLLASVVDAVPASKMIVFGPEDAERYVTVFTDIDCGYCRKFHQEVPKLNAAGVQVRYMAFPRSGVGSPSHKKFVSVWCNSDQQSALTAAKAGDEVVAANCDNPIAETYKLGQKNGVTGTPTIIYDNGKVLPGYVPSDKLLKQLGVDS